MAYYGSGFYGGEIGEYHYEYDHVVPYPDAEYSYEPKLIDYCPTDYGVYSYSDYDEQPAFVHPYPSPSIAYKSSYSYPEVNYSVYSLSQPKLITYEPIPCDIGYAVSQTQYSISYSTKISEFDEPEFDEYDPTPYDGGYDIALTYGKPLPPSDKICYPISNPEPSGLPSKDISYGIIPVPTPKLGDAGDLETPRGGDEKVNVGDSDIPADSIVKVDETEIGNKNGESGDLLSIEKVCSDGSDVGEPLESEQDEEDRQVEYTFSSYSDYGYDYPWSGYGYGNGKQVREGPPCEYNSDTVDLCESIFGHWPCLARMQQRSNGIKEDVKNGGRNDNNPWETTADYIFGDPFGKDEGRYYSGGFSSYGCENYYQQQPSSVTEVHYDERSWIHKLNRY